MERKNNHRTKKTARPGAASPRAPKKAMTRKEDVENSNDPKIDEDFPGYPHGNAREGVIKHQKTN